MLTDDEQARVDRIVAELSKLLAPLPDNTARIRALLEVAAHLGIDPKEFTDNPEWWRS